MPREIMKRQGDEASMSTQPGRKDRQTTTYRGRDDSTWNGGEKSQGGGDDELQLHVDLVDDVGVVVFYLKTKLWQLRCCFCACTRRGCFEMVWLVFFRRDACCMRTIKTKNKLLQFYSQNFKVPDVSAQKFV